MGCTLTGGFGTHVSKDYFKAARWNLPDKQDIPVLQKSYFYERLPVIINIMFNNRMVNLKTIYPYIPASLKRNCTVWVVE
jgi:hypothetical protein